MSLQQNSQARKLLTKGLERNRAVSRADDINKKLVQKRIDFCTQFPLDQLIHEPILETFELTPRASEVAKPKDTLDLNLYGTSGTISDNFLNDEQSLTQDLINLDLQGDNQGFVFEVEEPKKRMTIVDTKKMARLDYKPKLLNFRAPAPQAQIQVQNHGPAVPSLHRANTSVKKSSICQLGLVRVKDYGFYKQNLIGCGSFSRVYRGFKLADTSQHVAIKEIKISNVGERKLQQEIAVHQTMVHSQYIVHLHDYWIDRVSDLCYLILEFCPQGSLDQQFRTLNKQKSIQYFVQLLKAMHDLQKNNIIHRDLKLENILIKNNQIKLADFGFARPLPEGLSVQSQKCGTPATMAPELIFNDHQKVTYTDRQDVWSLGVILHELVYKEHPYAQNRERMRSNQRVFVASKDPIVENFLQGSLQYDPNMRMSLQQCFDHEISTCQRNELGNIQMPKAEPCPKRFQLYNDTLDAKPRKLVFSPTEMKEEKNITPFAESAVRPSEFTPMAWMYSALAVVLGFIMMLGKRK